MLNDTYIKILRKDLDFKNVQLKDSIIIFIYLRYNYFIYLTLTEFLNDIINVNFNKI